MNINNNYELHIFYNKKFKVQCNNKPNKSIRSNNDIENSIFLPKCVFIYFTMSFFVITWGDSFVVKALECGQKGYG
jgi:hypothetical protein